MWENLHRLFGRYKQRALRKSKVFIRRKIDTILRSKMRRGGLRRVTHPPEADVNINVIR